jgi:hypothetical protein
MLHAEASKTNTINIYLCSMFTQGAGLSNPAAAADRLTRVGLEMQMPLHQSPTAEDTKAKAQRQWDAGSAYQ